MPRTTSVLAALCALTPLAQAGIKFTSPAAGDKLTAGTAIDVKWEEGGTGPTIANLLSYELFLYAGGTTGEQIQLASVTTQGKFAMGNTASGMIPVTAGDNTPANAYYLKMVAVATAGGQLITYSDRFSYSGMTAKFPASIQAGLDAGITGTAGPDTVDNTGTNQATGTTATGAYGVAYTMQTGLTRYAPMQPVPPTKITAKNTQPLYPTSSVSIAKTNLPIPKIQTTLTQSQTFSVSSRENTVAAAAHPSDDMAKYLARWKD